MFILFYFSTFPETHLDPVRSVRSSFKPSSILFEIPNKFVNTSETKSTTFQLYASPMGITNKFRQKSLFVSPIILNDSNLLSQIQYNRNPIVNVLRCSSSTIDDADSILLSSSSTQLSYQERKHNTLYKSLPILPTFNHADLGNTTLQMDKKQYSNDESGPELDQISDLTSKMFSSNDEEDFLIVDNSTSTSSSITISSDAEKLEYM